MTAREKLVELLEYHCAVIGEAKCKAAKEEICSPGDCAGCLADHLIANGVTVQRWIPVTEELPDVEKETNAIRVTQTVQATDGKEHFFGYFTIYKYDESWQFVCADEAISICAVDTVTHWHPLPEVPKEDTK